MENAKKLAKLIGEGYKLIDRSFEEYKRLSSQDNFNDLEFLIKFNDKAYLWEKRVIKVLKMFNQQNYLLKFEKPNNIKSSKGIYITEESENRLSAQLQVLRDILTEVEHKGINPSSNNNIYWIDYTINREILLNGKLLHRPRPDSPSENLFSYLFNHPNQIIELKKVEESEGRTDISDNIHQKIRDLGFSGILKKIFFPIVTKLTIQFSNPITQDYLTTNHLPNLPNVK